MKKKGRKRINRLFVKMERYVWQKLGKTKKEKERRVNLSANRETLEFVRENKIVSVKDVAEKFEINLDCSHHRLSRLKESGYLSSRHIKNKLVFFPTLRGFSKMPREKGLAKKQEPKIIEKEKIREVTKINETKFIREI